MKEDSGELRKFYDIVARRAVWKYQRRLLWYLAAAIVIVIVREWREWLAEAWYNLWP